MNKDNKIFEDILECLIKEAAPKAAESLANKIPECDCTVEFSKKHEDNMKRLFKRERNKLFRKSMIKYRRRTVVFVTIVLITMGVMIYSVDAWRVRFMNMILEIKPELTMFNFSEVNSEGNRFVSDEIVLNYVPTGFLLEDRKIDYDYIYLQFANDEGDNFNLSVYNINANVGIDTEDAVVKNVKINGNEGIYSTNKNINILLWHDNEFVYDVVGNISEAEIMKIAENLIKQK